jgi:molybdopterin-guanine dinucleotide biosynthesis protein A
MKIVGVVLAGGLSSRMGGPDKCLLELNGKTLLKNAADRLAQQVNRVIINANSDSDIYKSYGLPVVPDSFEGFAGPLAGVLSGMEWAASEGADYIATVAADTPFFPVDLVAIMQQALIKQDGQIAIAETMSTEGAFHNHPTFGLWPVNLRDDLLLALNTGVRKVVQWANVHGVAKAKFSAKPFDPFFNINRPEDFDKARQLMKDYSI